MTRADRTAVEYAWRRAAHLPSKACWLKLRKQRLKELKSDLRQPKRESHQMEMGV